MLSLYKHNWNDYSLQNIIGGKSADGVSLLGLFLKDYSKEFNTKTLNASCRSCISTYLKNYKSKFRQMDNKCDYVLHKKREGLQLDFGSNIFVNNNNITNDRALKLIKRYKKAQGDKFELSYLFEAYPKEEVKEIIVTLEEPKEQPKKKRTRKNKK